VPQRAPDAAAVDEFLQRLARAVQQFRTYPATSPLCESAVDAVRQALATLDHREHIAFRVTPRELLVDDTACGRGTGVEQELARRLHAASVAEVTIDRSVSAREIARFCLDLVQTADRTTRTTTSLIDLLAEHGVDRVAVRAAYRPEVLDIGQPAPGSTGIIDQQRLRREEALATGVNVNHLYPPDKGWARLDPSSSLSSISLVDLAVLARDPVSLASMLLRLTDSDTNNHDTPDDALTQKFSDVATLINALEPRVARIMFARLAEAVLALDPDRRQALLRRTILPGLLDGKIEGGVLRDFPDLDLADALCLLLDLETAAPEVVTSALLRLDLPDERHRAVAPLLERRLNERIGEPARDTSVDAHARRLLRVDKSQARSFAEFAAFDLAVDEQTSATLVRIREAIAESKPLEEQLACLLRLTRLQPNPEVVQRLFGRTAHLLAQLQKDGPVRDLGVWLERYRALASSLAESRPDVAAVISSGLEQLGTPECVALLMDLAERDDQGREAASAIVRAIGSGLATPLLAIAHNRSGSGAAAKAATRLLCDHASVVAPALAGLFRGADAEQDRTIARVLGHAGPGFESVLAAGLSSSDEHTVRESLRALAKIGSPQAATLICAEIERDNGWRGPAAEETLWRFPPAHATRLAKGLLERHDFVVKHPELAARLLERVAQGGPAGLESILAGLVSLRFRIWNPALVRLARRAQVVGKG
jgi:hypothetical protein